MFNDLKKGKLVCMIKKYKNDVCVFNSNICNSFLVVHLECYYNVLVNTGTFLYIYKMLLIYN